MLFWSFFIFRNKTSVFKIKGKIIKTPVKLVMQGTYILLPNTFGGEAYKYTIERYVHKTHTNPIMPIKHNPLPSAGTVITVQ